MKQFICTFGYWQDNFGKYVVVNAPDQDTAHAIMQSKYPVWSMIYDSPERAGVNDWGLALLDTLSSKDKA